MIGDGLHDGLSKDERRRRNPYEWMPFYWPLAAIGGLRFLTPQWRKTRRLLEGDRVGVARMSSVSGAACTDTY